MGSTKMTNVPCVLHTTLPSTFSVSLVVASIDLLFVVVLNVLCHTAFVYMHLSCVYFQDCMLCVELHNVNCIM